MASGTALDGDLWHRLTTLLAPLQQNSPRVPCTTVPTLLPPKLTSACPHCSTESPHLPPCCPSQDQVSVFIGTLQN